MPSNLILRSVLASAAALATAAAMAGTTVPAQNGHSHNSVFGKAPAGNVIFDQGPGTGTNGGCWSNYTESQNFSDLAPLPAGTAITDIVVFTCIAPTTGTVSFKAVDESTHTFLYTESGTPSSWVDDGNGGFIVTYTLANPYVVPGTGTLGYGLSGDGFELGQNSVLTPGDGFMAQYSGQSYAFQAGVGDQMFQLLGGSGSCDVNGDGKYSAADLIDYLRTCRHDGGGEKVCFVKMLKFARGCGWPGKN